MKSSTSNGSLLVVSLAFVFALSACDVEDADQLAPGPGLQTAPTGSAAPEAFGAPDELETQLDSATGEAQLRRMHLKKRRDAGVTTPIDAGTTATVADAGTSAPPPAAIDAGTTAPPPPVVAIDAGVPTTPPPPPAVDAGTPTAPFVDAGTPTSGLWVTGYYAGWTRTTMPPTAIDFRALTHLVDFSLRPRADGTLEDQHGILGNAPATLSAAHAGGAKVLLCIGGAQTAAGFQGATSSARLTAFVDNIVSVVTRFGYDGVDVDWEPLTSADRPAYVAFVNALHARLSTMTPRRQLTAAVDSWSSTTLALVADKFDQVNLMTYDMANTGSDSVSWFNSPLHNGGATRPSGTPQNSAERSVQSYTGNGHQVGKLGIGVAFYGNMYSGGAGTPTGGVTAPRQAWTTAPTMTAIDYRVIMTQWHTASRYRFDDVTKGAWLTVDELGGANDRYINYDDPRTIAAKLAWAKQRGVGGVIIWQLAGGYLPAAPAGERDPLLQAIRANR